MDGTEIWSVEEADGYEGEIRREERGSNWDSCSAWGVSSRITHLTPSPATAPSTTPPPRHPKKKPTAPEAGHSEHSDNSPNSFCSQNAQAHKGTHIGIEKKKTMSSSDRMGAFPTLG